MAVRTNATNVLSVLQQDYDAVRAPSLTRFMAMASKLVDRMVTCAANKGYTFDSEELEMLECLLTAHFYQMSDPGYTSKSTKSASGSFRGTYTRKLDATPYGQQAMLLDVSGCLENFDKRQVAGMAWLGKAESDQLTYEERN